MPISPKTPTKAADGDPLVAHLRPYTFHGLDLTVQGPHAVGDCPFCGREGKFSIEVATGLGRCWVCGVGSDRGGFNALTFVRELYAHAAGIPAPGTPQAGRNGVGGHGPARGLVPAAAGRLGPFFAAVAADRRLASPATPAAWGVCPCPVDGKTWLVPGYGPDGRLDQVYRRTRVQEKGEWVWRLLPTPGIWPEGKVHALHMPVGDLDLERRTSIDVFEGPWDGAAAWEARGSLGDSNVVAVPGCNVWRDEWTAMCRGKHVRLWFDSDHPRKVGQSTREFRAGLDGMQRVAKRLTGVAASVSYISWGPDGYDITRPTGWDVRDQLTEQEDRGKALADLLLKVVPVPADWTVAPPPPGGGVLLYTANRETLPCQKWQMCEAAWRDAMYWRQDLSDATAVLLAICASTPQAGNQLFLDLIGSPGSAKTTICQGLLTSSHCIHLENITKILSGWKKPDDETKDCSFLARANGKTWITCEFDVLGSSPHYHELMGKVRRIFDGETSTTYGNDDKDRVYTALRTPWIRAGTQKMMDRMGDFDQSQLGDRFMRFIISDPSDGDRRSIAKRALRSERAAILERVNGSATSVVDPKTRTAHMLTGGYVDWLREQVEEELARLDVPEYAEDYCVDLAELSANMRARPNEDRRSTNVNSTKELPTRLARQNMRLAMCLAVVLNKFSVDTEVLRIVRKVALDTAHGHSLNIAHWLCSPNPKAGGKSYQECGGIAEGTLATWTGMSPERLLNYLNFLRKVDVLQLRKAPQMGDSWLLTDHIYDLYLRVRRG